MNQPPAVRATPSALLALCLVALQLATALHFALVPHGFSAGLSGFVHVHAQAPRRARPQLEPALRRSLGTKLVSDSAACVGEACPLGFAGHHSLLLGRAEASARLTLALGPALAPSYHYDTARSRVLLSAPKTSPPA